MKTVEELNRVRARARAALSPREGPGLPRVSIAMGTCGIASGAREVLLAILEELSQRGLEEVRVTQTGCRGLCDREPMIEVQKAGLPTVTYADLDPEKARAIVAQHLARGVIVAQWVLTRAERPEPTA